MLAQGPRIAEPAQVADVDQDGRTRFAVGAGLQRGQQIGAEQIFVADVEGDVLAAHCKRRLARRAAIEIAQRHVQQVDEPAESRRHVFAPRHQMALVVAHGGVATHQLFDRRVAVKAHHAVGVAVTAVHAVMQGHAHGDRHVAACGHAAPGFPGARIQLVLENGQHRFGQNHQLRRGHALGGRQSRHFQMAHQALLQQGRIKFL
ncbi:hypothetical protein D3C72_1256180 [compost metagenome]